MESSGNDDGDEVENILEDSKLLAEKIGCDYNNVQQRKNLKMLSKFIVKEMTLEFSEHQSVSRRFMGP